MSEKNRVNLIFVLWFFSAIALAALFISATAQGELTSAHVAIAFMILGLAIIGTPYILRQHEPEIQRPDEKAKRQSVDSVLSNLSDEELVELKQRLSEGDYSVEALANSLGDDGEKVLRS